MLTLPLSSFCIYLLGVGTGVGKRLTTDNGQHLVLTSLQQFTHKQLHVLAQES